VEKVEQLDSDQQDWHRAVNAAMVSNAVGGRTCKARTDAPWPCPVQCSGPIDIGQSGSASRRHARQLLGDAP